MFTSIRNSSSNKLVFLYAQILVLSLFCFLLLLGHGKMPEKVDVLFPKGADQIWLYSDDIDNKGGSKAWWTEKSENKFKCNITHVIATPYCGFEIQLTPDYQGLDLSDYKLFKIYLDYDGPSTQIGITLRTFEKSSYKKGDISSLKNSVVPIGSFELIDVNTPILIEPKEWQVFHWWLDQYNIPRKNSYTDFSNVVVIGLTLSGSLKDGEHTMQFKKIEMVKNTISEKHWFVFVVSLWLLLIFLLMSWNLIKVLKQSKLHQEEAMTDDLTGLKNRKGMTEYLKSILKKNKTVNLSMILFDLDFFKKINDNYGHDAGDQVLINISNLIKNTIRNSDCFCRWGGEEFAILCPSMPIEKARELAYDLCDLVSSFDITDLSNTINVTASFGISNADIDKYSLLDELFEQSDNALFRAKNTGRNRVE
ncbi:MAG: GGDEF domain-containing protein [Pseudomonadales bacterium]|nr:GGDEF domain-containing protein [Pseudomonadales bacterium]